MGQSGMPAWQSAVNLFLLGWGLLLALKLVLAIHLPLFGDEAFYAWAALHPAWAYSDLPGATAAAIGIGTLLAGDTWFGVRWPTVLLGAALPWLVVRIASRLGDPASAWRAGLWSLPIPLLLPLGTLAVPDALLCFAILLVLDAALGLVLDADRQRPAAVPGWQPLHLQLALGLALGALTHYRFAPVLLIGGLALWALAPRAFWRAPGLWAALLLGVLAWGPVLAFNLDAAGAGLRFQLIDRHPWSFDAEGLLQPLAQALATTPLLYLLFLLALWRGWRRSGGSRLLAVCAAGLLLFYAVLAPFADRARFSLHWPLPAYLIACALLPAAIDAGLPAKRWLLAATRLLLGLGLLLVTLALALPAIPAWAARTAGTGLYPDNFLGWTEITAALRPRLQPGDVVVADHFMLAAQLSFGLDRRAEVFVLDHWNNHKHGRAAQLARWGYDEAGLERIRPGTRVWLLFEVEETPEAERLAWVARSCRWFESPRFVDRVEGPGGGKSFWIFESQRLADAGSRACEPSLPQP